MGYGPCNYLWRKYGPVQLLLETWDIVRLKSISVVISCSLSRMTTSSNLGSGKVNQNSTTRVSVMLTCLQLHFPQWQLRNYPGMWERRSEVFSISSIQCLGMVIAHFRYLQKCFLIFKITHGRWIAAEHLNIKILRQGRETYTHGI